MHERMEQIKELFDQHEDWSVHHHERDDDRDWLELIHQSTLNEEGDENHIYLGTSRNHRNVVRLFIEDDFYGPVEHYIQVAFDEVMKQAPNFPQHYLGMSNSFYHVMNINCDAVKWTARYYQWSELYGGQK